MSAQSRRAKIGLVTFDDFLVSVSICSSDRSINKRRFPQVSGSVGFYTVADPKIIKLESMNAQVLVNDKTDSGFLVQFHARTDASSKLCLSVLYWCWQLTRIGPLNDY